LVCSFAEHGLNSSGRCCRQLLDVFAALPHIASNVRDAWTNGTQLLLHTCHATDFAADHVLHAMPSAHNPEKLDQAATACMACL
jgi:hypothetical protein